MSTVIFSRYFVQLVPWFFAIFYDSFRSTFWPSMNILSTNAKLCVAFLVLCTVHLVYFTCWCESCESFTNVQDCSGGGSSGFSFHFYYLFCVACWAFCRVMGALTLSNEPQVLRLMFTLALSRR